MHIGKHFLTIILTFLVIVAVTSICRAIPALISFQGVIKDDQGTPVSGNRIMEFHVY
jgi:hypothetical protein